MRPGIGTRFVVASLATWRVSHLIAEEDGPADVVVKLRARLGSSLPGQLMDCFACTSLWVAAPLARTVAGDRRDLPVVWLALSGAACMLERATAGLTAVPASSPETEGDLDVLWAEAQRVEG